MVDPNLKAPPSSEPPDAGPRLLERLMDEIRTTAAFAQTLAPFMPLLGPMMALAPLVWAAALQAARDLHDGHPPADIAQQLAQRSSPHIQTWINNASQAALLALQDDERFDRATAQLDRAIDALADNPHIPKMLQALHDHLTQAFDRTLATLVDQALAGQTNPLLVDALQIVEHLTQLALATALDTITAAQPPAPHTERTQTDPPERPT
ncbi:MAG: hypothetical protein AAFS10_25780 [Myxococcota bacterium]